MDIFKERTENIMNEVPFAAFRSSMTRNETSVDMKQVVGSNDILFVCLDTLRYDAAVEEEKNGYYFGKYNKIDELINDYVYVKRADYESFCQERDVIVDVDLDYEKIYRYSRTIHPIHSHMVKPLYVKLIEVQK